MIEPGHAEISVSRQCELIGLNRSMWYYRPVDESEEDLPAKRLIDDQYTSTPFYGARRMKIYLKSQGLDINRKRVMRLMQEMRIQAIYPKPRLSTAARGHEIYPYLLGGLSISRPDQVWSSDITYIRMSRGFVYLTAIMDRYSRYVLSWLISNTMDVHFCLEALREVLMKSKPEIFNTDQGSQYTSIAFTGMLINEDIRISMDSRGRAFDNIFIERLWRSVKYEEVYLNEYESVKQVVQGMNRYFEFYNTRRPHQSLGYRTPHEVH